MQKHELSLRRHPPILASKRVGIEAEIHSIPGCPRPWRSKHISTARMGNQYTKRTLFHRKTGESAKEVRVSTCPVYGSNSHSQ